MKEAFPNLPTKPVDENNLLPLCGENPPIFFHEIDWWVLACMRKPLINISFEKMSDEDWLLYDLIDMLAENMAVDFDDAAHWALRQALGKHFASARKMFVGLIPWAFDIQYVCRIFTLQLCKCYKYRGAFAPQWLDKLIKDLLVTDEELLLEAKYDIEPLREFDFRNGWSISI